MDHYTTLGVNKSASQDEIKKAYRKLAHKHHPDKKGGDEKKFKGINEAYQVLSNPEKRSQYDKFGSTFNAGQNPGGGPDGFDFSQSGFGDFFKGQQGGQNFDFEDIFDVFGSAFGFGRSHGQSSSAGQGADIYTNLNISFYDAARGREAKIEFSRNIICPECSGSGARNKGDLKTCPECDGNGKVRETKRSIFGSFARIKICGTCHGKGKIPKENCPKCGGEGRRKEKQILKIKIPAGIKDGETLAMRNMGQAGFRGEPAGNLYISIRVEPDRRFQRLNDDILYEMPVKLTDALLGANLAVPTLDGEVKIRIPAGARDGQEFRIKGAGIHGRRKGDEIVKINVQMPQKLSGKAKKLVEELANEI